MLWSLLGGYLEKIMKSLMKYFTSAPIMATVVLVGLSVVMIELNAVFPGLQYGTYFHSLP